MRKALVRRGGQIIEVDIDDNHVNQLHKAQMGGVPQEQMVQQQMPPQQQGQGSEQDQVMRLIQAYAEAKGISLEEIMQQLQQMDPQAQQQAIQQMAKELQQGQQGQQAQPPPTEEMPPQETMQKGGNSKGRLPLDSLKPGAKIENFIGLVQPFAQKNYDLSFSKDLENEFKKFQTGGYTTNEDGTQSYDLGHGYNSANLDRVNRFQNKSDENAANGNTFGAFANLAYTGAKAVGNVVNTAAKAAATAYGGPAASAALSAVNQPKDKGSSGSGGSGGMDMSSLGKMFGDSGGAEGAAGAAASGLDLSALASFVKYGGSNGDSLYKAQFGGGDRERKKLVASPLNQGTSVLQPGLKWVNDWISHPRFAEKYAENFPNHEKITKFDTLVSGNRTNVVRDREDKMYKNTAKWIPDLLKSINSAPVYFNEDDAKNTQLELEYYNTLSEEDKQVYDRNKKKEKTPPQGYTDLNNRSIHITNQAGIPGNSNPNAVLAHEYVHYIEDDSGKATLSGQPIYQPLGKSYTKFFSDVPESKWLLDDTGKPAKPKKDEFLPFLWQLRQEHGITGDDIIDQEWINKIRKTGDKNPLLRYYDDNQLIEYFNTLVNNTPGQGQPQYQQQIQPRVPYEQHVAYGGTINSYNPNQLDAFLKRGGSLPTAGEGGLFKKILPIAAGVAGTAFGGPMVGAMANKAVSGMVDGGGGGGAPAAGGGGGGFDPSALVSMFAKFGGGLPRYQANVSTGQVGTGLDPFTDSYLNNAKGPTGSSFVPYNDAYANPVQDNAKPQAWNPGDHVSDFNGPNKGPEFQMFGNEEIELPPLEEDNSVEAWRKQMQDNSAATEDGKNWDPLKFSKKDMKKYNLDPAENNVTQKPSFSVKGFMQDTKGVGIAAAGLFEAMGNKKKARLAQNQADVAGLGDHMFTANTADRGDRGDYGTNVLMPNFRPNEYIPMKGPRNSQVTKYGAQIAKTGTQVQNPYMSNPNSHPEAILYGEPDQKISNTLQPVKREQANLEAEVGEVAVTPAGPDGVPKFFKIGGKNHYDGGTPLSLPENTFIFSKTRSMIIKDPKILKELTGSAKPATPADLAKKFDFSEYVAVLQNENSDSVERKTAQMMIESMIYKLGQIAIIQEAKKGFPSGIPLIAVPYLEKAGIDPQMLLPKTQQEPQQEDPEMQQQQMDPAMQEQMMQQPQEQMDPRMMQEQMGQPAMRKGGPFKNTGYDIPKDQRSLDSIIYSNLGKNITDDKGGRGYDYWINKLQNDDDLTTEEAEYVFNAMQNPVAKRNPVFTFAKTPSWEEDYNAPPDASQFDLYTGNQDLANIRLYRPNQNLEARRPAGYGDPEYAYGGSNIMGSPVLPIYQRAGQFDDLNFAQKVLAGKNPITNQASMAPKESGAYMPEAWGIYAKAMKSRNIAEIKKAAEYMEGIDVPYSLGWMPWTTEQDTFENAAGALYDRASMLEKDATQASKGSIQFEEKKQLLDFRNKLIELKKSTPADLANIDKIEKINEALKETSAFSFENGIYKSWGNTYKSPLSLINAYQSLFTNSGETNNKKEKAVTTTKMAADSTTQSTPAPVKSQTRTAPATKAKTTSTQTSTSSSGLSSGTKKADPSKVVFVD